MAIVYNTHKKKEAFLIIDMVKFYAQMLCDADITIYVALMVYVSVCEMPVNTGNSN